MVTIFAASPAAMPRVSARSRLVQDTNPRVSFKKLITAAAGTAGMISVPDFDFLLDMFSNLSEKNFWPQTKDSRAAPPGAV